MLAVLTAHNAAYSKVSGLVKALSKLMLHVYEKYDILRMITRRNVVLMLRLVLYLSLTHSFPCHIFHIALVAILSPLYITTTSCTIIVPAPKNCHIHYSGKHLAMHQFSWNLCTCYIDGYIEQYNLFGMHLLEWYYWWSAT